MRGGVREGGRGREGEREETHELERAGVRIQTDLHSWYCLCVPQPV